MFQVVFCFLQTSQPAVFLIQTTRTRTRPPSATGAGVRASQPDTMRRHYLTVIIACVFCLLILGTAGYRNYKTHNVLLRFLRVKLLGRSQMSVVSASLSFLRPSGRRLRVETEVLQHSSGIYDNIPDGTTQNPSPPASEQGSVQSHHSAPLTQIEVVTKNHEHKGKGRYRAKQAGWSTYSRLYHYLLKREKPWLLLPNHNQCFQNWCNRNEDCCRGYNICDASAKVCIDCWYGYHCRSSANCCENFPICEKKYDEEYGRCVNPNY